MDYGQIISQSWNLLWKHKILWIFGFLAALGSGGGGNFNINNRFGGPVTPPGPDVLSPELRQQIEHLIQAFQRGTYSEAMNTASDIIGFPVIFLVGLICFVIVFVIFLWLVTVVARAGLVAAVQADHKSESISWRQLVSVGISKLWQLIGLKFILFGIPGLLLPLLFMASFVPMFLSVMKGFSTGQIEPLPANFVTLPFLICGFICISIPLSLALYIVDGYAFRGIVMDDMEIFQGIKHGWRVGMDNIGPTIILGIIFTVAGLAVVAVIMIPASIFGFIYDDVGSVITAVTTLASVIIWAVISTVFVTMQSISYSKAYLEFTATKPVPVPVLVPGDVPVDVPVDANMELPPPDEALHKEKIDVS